MMVEPLAWETTYELLLPFRAESGMTGLGFACEVTPDRLIWDRLIDAECPSLPPCPPIIDPLPIIFCCWGIELDTVLPW